MIVPLTTAHSAAVARLHLDYLRSNFTGEPGRRLLQANYQTIAAGVGACGYVAESADGETVLGYICGVWDAGSMQNRLLRTCWPQLIVWGVFQIIRRPRLLSTFLARFGSSPAIETSQPRGYELRPIVVAPAARGAGVALDLVNCLLADAARRGFQSIFLLTEPNNIAANAFYHKAGFTLTETVTRQGATYNRYERPIREAV